MKLDPLPEGAITVRQLLEELRAASPDSIVFLQRDAEGRKKILDGPRVVVLSP